MFEVSSKWREWSKGREYLLPVAGEWLATVAYRDGWPAAQWGITRGSKDVARGKAETIEQAQLAAESWLRDRAMEILAVVGEEQR